MKKAVVANEVASEIAVGNSGRFYHFTAFDLKGIHGLRKPDGTSVYSYPGKSNKMIFASIIPMSLVWIALRLADKGDIPLLAIGLIILGAFGWHATSKSERETREQFDADAGPAAAPLAAAP